MLGVQLADVLTRCSNQTHAQGLGLDSDYIRR